MFKSVATPVVAFTNLICNISERADPGFSFRRCTKDYVHARTSWAQSKEVLYMAGVRPKMKCLYSGTTFHTPLTKSALLNRLLHCSLWQFSGVLFLHFGGKIAQSPPPPSHVIFPLSLGSWGRRARKRVARKSSSRVLNALSCYLSLIFKHSDANWDTKKYIYPKKNWGGGCLLHLHLDLPLQNFHSSKGPMISRNMKLIQMQFS